MPRDVALRWFMRRSVVIFSQDYRLLTGNLSNGGLT
jgi:hypothetical protein